MSKKSKVKSIKVLGIPFDDNSSFMFGAAQAPKLIREGLKQALDSQADLEVVGLAEDGQIALEMVKRKNDAKQRYDTILTDFEMPVMNGPEFVKAMRAAGLDTFVVGITGNQLVEDVDYFLSCGANAVFPKPFKMSDLEDLWVENGVAD